MNSPRLRLALLGAAFLGSCGHLSALEAGEVPDPAPVFLCGGELFWLFVAIFFVFRFFASKAEPEQTGFPRPRSTPGQKKLQEALEEFHREAPRQQNGIPSPAVPRPSVSARQKKNASTRSQASHSGTGSPSPSYSASYSHPHAGTPAHSNLHTNEILAPVYELAGHGKLELLRKKLEKGANINERDPFFGETALHRAAKRGDAAMVRFLLESGADARFVTVPYGETPLHFAIAGRDPQVVRLLLQYGASPNVKDCFGRTPAQCSRFYADLREIFESSGTKTR